MAQSHRLSFVAEWGLEPRSPESQTQSKKKLSVCSKVCYAIGGAPYQITGCALGFFLQIYLLDVAQLDPFSASIILFVGRAWDAVTDPLVGFFLSKTSWSRMGRLMPWIVFSTPFAVISYFLIWFVPDVSQGQVMWYLFFYCIFQTLVTCFHVPYSALTMFISREQSERDSATAYRMTVEVLGTVLGTAVQGQIVGKADTPCIPDPLLLPVLNSSSVAVGELNITHDTGSLTDTRNAYMLAAGVIGGIYILCAAILFAGVRERRESSELHLDKPASFFQGLKLVMKHGPYIKLIAAFLFTSLAFMLLEGNFALFCTYTLGFRNEFQNVLLAIMLSATLTIPFWQWFLTRFGKKTAVYIGISVSQRPQEAMQVWSMSMPLLQSLPGKLGRALTPVGFWAASGLLVLAKCQTNRPGSCRIPPGLDCSCQGLHPRRLGALGKSC
uniref:Major facilitator superfamily domain containing 2A n=1 Tax=Varanus komodoensis TaxID=61221 RepID=A0A8D2L592_VARKO